MFPKPNRCCPSERQAAVPLRPPLSRTSARLASIPVLQAQILYLTGPCPGQHHHTRPKLSARDSFSPSWGRTAEHEVPSTGPQNKGGVQDELYCHQRPHSPVQSDSPHTPVVLDPECKPKVSSLVSWQDSMRRICNVFPHTKRTALGAIPPNPLPIFNPSSPCLAHEGRDILAAPPVFLCFSMSKALFSAWLSLSSTPFFRTQTQFKSCFKHKKFPSVSCHSFLPQILQSSGHFFPLNFY